MNNFEFIGRAISVHRECENLFGLIGRKVDSIVESVNNSDVISADDVAYIKLKLIQLKSSITQYNEFVNTFDISDKNTIDVIKSNLVKTGFTYSDENTFVYSVDEYSLVLVRFTNDGIKIHLRGKNDTVDLTFNEFISLMSMYLKDNNLDLLINSMELAISL